ncbi:hypothetical protein Pfo_016749 [Paulownia fortunei]|nr:hypothetical protein Pfo_016749 [Paulownia fortunei]
MASAQILPYNFPWFCQDHQSSCGSGGNFTNSAPIGPLAFILILRFILRIAGGNFTNSSLSSPSDRSRQLIS